jgi:hypothetical protein
VTKTKTPKAHEIFLRRVKKRGIVALSAFINNIEIIIKKKKLFIFTFLLNFIKSNYILLYFMKLLIILSFYKFFLFFTKFYSKIVNNVYNNINIFLQKVNIVKKIDEIEVFIKK